MEQTVLDLIALGFNLEDFYNISIWQNSIWLQGYVTDEKLKKYSDKGFVFVTDAYRVAEKGNVRITLS